MRARRSGMPGASWRCRLSGRLLLGGAPVGVDLGVAGRTLHTETVRGWRGKVGWGTRGGVSAGPEGRGRARRMGRLREKKKEIGSLPAHPGWTAGTARGGDAEGPFARVPQARRCVGKGRSASPRALGMRGSVAGAPGPAAGLDPLMLTRGWGNGRDPASKSSAIARGAARGEGSNLDGLGRGDALAYEGGGGEHGGHGVVFVRGATACVRMCAQRTLVSTTLQDGAVGRHHPPDHRSRASQGPLGTRSRHTLGRARREDGARSRWSRRPRPRRRR